MLTKERFDSLSEFKRSELRRKIEELRPGTAIAIAFITEGYITYYKTFIVSEKTIMGLMAHYPEGPTFMGRDEALTVISD